MQGRQVAESKLPWVSLCSTAGYGRNRRKGSTVAELLVEG